MNLSNCKIDNILVLFPDKEEFWAKEIAKQGINVETLYKPCNVFLRVIRKIWLISGIFSPNIWCGAWKKDIKKYDTILVHANKITAVIPKYIKKQSDKCRVIYWFWDPVSNCTNPERISDEYSEKWSFDPIDSKQYNLKFNTTYYFKDLKLPENNIKYDVFFIGQDKGRLDYLMELENTFKNIGVSNYFHIVEDRWKHKKKEYKLSKKISYNESLKYIAQSKAILDIVQQGQNGQTLRAMESLFFSKKLITNNKEIKNCDFYCKDNIFILGVDNLYNLNDFLNTLYQPVDNIIIENYEFDKWLKRFNI